MQLDRPGRIKILSSNGFCINVQRDKQQLNRVGRIVGIMTSSLINIKRPDALRLSLSAPIALGGIRRYSAAERDRTTDRSPGASPLYITSMPPCAHRVAYPR